MRAAEPELRVTGPAETQVKRALLSVSDRRGLAEFARGLADLGVEIVSTGGTARDLESHGIRVRSVEDYTGAAEMLDGRVKTLHPRVHAGLLAVRSNPDHVAALIDQGIEPIDLVCVNLYPFERTAYTRGVTDAEVMEQIDVGGPALIRAGAKNHPFTAVVVRPESYDAVLEELRGLGLQLSQQTREALAMEAFSYTARYDAAIARWFSEREEGFPGFYTRAFEKVLDLSYGENPHQRAAYYAQTNARTHLLSMVSKLHGRELSFNNLLDFDSGRRLVEEFEIPAAAIIKHNNPCGCALAGTPGEAYARALAADRASAYGGVVCLNGKVDAALAEMLSSNFVELVAARDYDEDALEILQRKPNVRILRNAERRDWPVGEQDFRRVRGGILVQDRDQDFESREEMAAVTDRKPTEHEWGELLFAWRVAKHVRSNAIVLARDLATVGIGAGQMSRLDSVRLAVEKAATGVEGAAMASDAFFPFADGPEVALEAGVDLIIQPGGSQRDHEVVEACDRAGAVMIFTSRRHFRH
jgi:phosphoribosylaminoimidazolecarboxamide formyltransferase/IMP cyclohydrolase